MIASLRGKPVARTPEGLVLDVGGVGYLVHATPRALARARDASETTLQTYLAVREDALQLYGFADAGERELFVPLLAVNGVGPKVALAVVSGSPAGELRRAIALGDAARFQAIPGIGKKTAERIVLELKERLGDAEAVPISSAAGTQPHAVAREALVELGYSVSEAEQALAAIALDLPPFTLVGATTRTGLLTTPLRDRFGMTFRLGYYEPAELATIVRRSARILGVELVDEAADEIAVRARGTPRVANRILRRVRDVAEVRHEGAITLEIAMEALELHEVDRIGLERADRDLLDAIAVKFGGGPVGLSTLAVALGEEPETIEDVYEPYLLQLGFIQRTPRGRVITDLGRAHIGATSAEDALF